MCILINWAIWYVTSLVLASELLKDIVGRAFASCNEFKTKSNKFKTNSIGVIHVASCCIMCAMPSLFAAAEDLDESHALTESSTVHSCTRLILLMYTSLGSWLGWLSGLWVWPSCVVSWVMRNVHTFIIGDTHYTCKIEAMSIIIWKWWHLRNWMMHCKIEAIQGIRMQGAFTKWCTIDK